MTRHEPSASADEPQIEARVGRLFRVSLPTPTASGYKWSPQFDDRILKLIGEKRHMNSRRMGAAVRTEFKFKPVQAGTYRIAFSMARPWEADEARSREVTVHVSE